MLKKGKNRESSHSAHHTPFAKKSFGQNFLVDQNYIDKIIAALDPQKDNTIIEIGPGRGALTERVIERARKVIAIELDKDLIPVLQGKFGHHENFQLIESDALKIDFEELLSTQPPTSGTFKLVANLPYYISTAILQKLIEQREAFLEMVLMFQREVVERIAAEPGNSERGFLTVLVDAYLEAQKLFDIPPTAFRPAPKIWSSVVRLTPKQGVKIENEELFREIVSAGFRQKRKTILNNLKNAPPNISGLFENKGGLPAILEASGIEPGARAESLSLEYWEELIRKIA